MAIEFRDFDNMVEDTCQRILDANIGITNTSEGSVTRTLVEAILSEVSIASYTTFCAYMSKTIDNAEGSDLDDIVSILSITRNTATKFVGIETFYLTEESDVDIIIPAGAIISTKENQNGDIYEFEVVETTILSAGELSVNVKVEAVNGGYIFLPKGSITVMSDDINDIAYINNETDFIGGKNDESDEELRDRAKDAVNIIGKGTSSAIQAAVADIDGVADVKVYDMKQGVGTSDVVLITDMMPPSEELLEEINAVIDATKASGIKIFISYPNTILHDFDVDIITDGMVDTNTIGDIIYQYINTMHIGQNLVLNQLERNILNSVDDNNADISFNNPTKNIIVTNNDIIRPNSITINGVVYYDRNN